MKDEKQDHRHSPEELKKNGEIGVHLTDSTLPIREINPS